MADPFEGFDRLVFTVEGHTYPLFRLGSGPGIIVMTEMPGISPKVAAFAAGWPTRDTPPCCRRCSGSPGVSRRSGTG